LINENGEEDLRAVYIVATIASILNLDTDELLENSSDFISEC
jgi:hypothetical protein